MSVDEATAYHEAGHIVVGLVHGLVIASADIIPAEGRAGVANFDDDRLFECDVDDELVDAWGAMTWAGVVAQERAGFPDDGTGFGYTKGRQGATQGSDLATVLELVGRFVGGDGDEASERWRMIAHRTLDLHWNAVERVASALVLANRITAEDAMRLLDEG
jgi:hypothetical protein